jgi:hypothetical protein
MRALALTLITLVGGCTHSVHQYSVSATTPVQWDRVRPIVVQSEQQVILATSEYTMLDEAYRKLLASCPRGDVVNVRLKRWTDHGFLSWTQKLRLEGGCVE